MLLLVKQAVGAVIAVTASSKSGPCMQCIVSTRCQGYIHLTLAISVLGI
jgi:hypothetical protein